MSRGERPDAIRVAVASGDAGSIAIAFPAISLAVLLLAGLGIDASRGLQLRGRALGYAEEAARAGAGAVDRELDAGSRLQLDTDRAADLVARYCAAAAASTPLDECTFLGADEVGDGDDRRIVVRTRVAMHEPTTLLGIIGLHTLTTTAEAKARPYEGTGPGDVDSDAPAVRAPVPLTVVAPPDLDAPPLPPPPPPLPTDAPTDGPTDTPTDEPADAPPDVPTGEPTVPTVPTGVPTTDGGQG